MFGFFKYKKKYNKLVDRIDYLLERERGFLSIIKNNNCTFSQENTEIKIKILEELNSFINKKMRKI
jgi:hypothetical protein